MDTLAEDLLKALASSGWQIERASRPTRLLPPSVSDRYQNIPSDVVEFLESVEKCTDSAGQIWVFTAEQYREQIASAFRWNELELMSLEAAEADSDSEWEATIREFWDTHFPFMMAVHSGYDYLAVDLSSGNYGHIVHGSAPEFEEVSTVACSFKEFVVKYAEAVRTGGSNALFPFVPARE